MAAGIACFQKILRQFVEREIQSRNPVKISLNIPDLHRTGNRKPGGGIFIHIGLPPDRTPVFKRMAVPRALARVVILRIGIAPRVEHRDAVFRGGEHRLDRQSVFQPFLFLLLIVLLRQMDSRLAFQHGPDHIRQNRRDFRQKLPDLRQIGVRGNFVNSAFK